MVANKSSENGAKFKYLNDINKSELYSWEN
jgi:hypothetical protein